MGMENGGLTASDVALLNNDGMGGWNGMIWLFAILAMMGGNFGGFGGNNGNAIQADVNRGFDNQNLQAQTRDILAAVTSGTAQSVAATNQTFHDNLAAMQSLYNETVRDIAALQVGQSNMLANQNSCCCETKGLIMQSNYEAAMRDAATNANIVAQNQKILDAITGNQMAAMQNRINQLELRSELAGVVRYPNGYVYTAGSNPFCGCSNCNM